MLGLVACVLACACAPAILAQNPPTNGTRRSDPAWHTLVHARVVTEPGQTLEDATLVVRDGKIVAIGTDIAPPAGARIWECTGLTVFPGLIEPHVPIDTPELPLGPERHWNANVRAEARASASPSFDEKARVALRRLGFTVAASAPRSGLFRGRAAVTLLHDDDVRTGRLARTAVLVEEGYQSVSFTAAGEFGDYPGSLMGAIALVRQTFADTAWRGRAQAAGEVLGPSASLTALAAPAASGAAPFVFHTRDELDVLRVAKVIAEFGLRGAVLASGTEFRRLPAIAATGLPLILPLDFPKPPDVATAAAQARTSLRDLMTWEQAPTNPRRAVAAGIRAALTSDRLTERGEFPARVREAIAHGLDPAQALAMSTTIPADLLGISSRVGTLAVGKLANFVVVRGGDGRHPYSKGSEIVATWVEGRPYAIAEAAPTDSSKWVLTANGAHPVHGTLRLGKGTVTLEVGETKVEGKSVVQRGARLDFLVAGDAFGEKGVFVMTASIEGERMFGQGITARGTRFAWRAMREGGDAARAERDEPEVPTVPEALPIPFGAYGRSELPAVEYLVVRNATLWTSADAGTVRDGVLVVRDGKVVYAGAAAGAPPTPGALELDAGGRHVTPGLIDCHSHTAISGGVNESGQAVTAEVRIADVLNPDDINIYRQLAGGLTAANALHGSANPIGGQNAVVKWRWGCAHPDDLRVAGAPEGIKFALGENPKRSRSRDENTRYPRTRLGVEAVLRDGFTAAAAYTARERAYRALSPTEKATTPPPPRDLELEALAEILAGTRLVHCHSYRQDEILMLCRVASDFGFQVGTFQHVLEGYKVADAIKTAARGASSFSDWWAYKFEVYDAIPYNGELMHRVGVNVSFNSDSSELARRMNTEAAKAVKYGGLDPHAALQFVTANPAFQLGAHGMIGQLTAGADADFALWSGDPLATTSRCEATWVDGRRLFSLADDAAMRAHAASERQRLIQKVLAQANRGKGRSGDRAPEGEDEANGRAYGCGECGCEEVAR